MKIGNKFSDLARDLKEHKFTIRELSSVIGILTSTFPGNKFGPLHYLEMDKHKTLGLKKPKENFGTPIKINKRAYF